MFLLSKNLKGIKIFVSVLFISTMLFSVVAPVTVLAEEAEVALENQIVEEVNTTNNGDISDLDTQNNTEEANSLIKNAEENTEEISEQTNQEETNSDTNENDTTNPQIVDIVVEDENIDDGQSLLLASGIEGLDSISKCPFVSGQNKTVVPFTTKPTGNPASEGKIFVTKLQKYSSTLPSVVNLTPGEYKVSLYFYDSYAGRSQTPQPNEKWFIRFYDDSDKVIAVSNVSSDLEDGVNTATKNEVVNGALNITSTSTKVIGTHVDYNNPNFASYGSLVPVCAFFEKKVETPVNTPPTITLIGANPFEITVGTVFVDPGATAKDLEDGDATTTANIIKTGSVNASTTGTYILTYSVTDSGGLSASTTRTVIVKPVFDPNTCQFVPQNGRTIVNFTNEKLYAGGDGQHYKTSAKSVNLAPGNYKVSLHSYDGYVGRKTASQPHEEWFVKFFDKNNALVAKSATSSDLADLVEEAFKAEVVNQSLALGATTTSIVGWHGPHVYSDTSNPNSVFPVCAAFDLIPDVKVNTPPTITLIGANPFEITVGTVFVDPGATAKDLEDGDATTTANIIRTGTVNASTTGTYILTYSVTDSGGLSASTTRTVIVKPVSNPNNPSVTLTANPQSITKGDSSTLTWGSQNTTACSAAWTSATSTSGSMSVSPAVTTDYVIVCTGPNGSATATTTITVNNPPANPPSGGGGGGGGGGGIGGRRHPIVVGEVLSATSCYYLRDFLKIDWKNDPIEVLKLQSFLNIFEGEKLSLTGNYDQATFRAVERFQTKYSSDILIPWGDKVTTGFVYILTKKKVNEIYCKAIFPISQLEQNEIDVFRSAGSAQYFYKGQNEYKSQNDSTGGEIGSKVNLKKAENPNAVKLKDNSEEKSVVRNLAVSLFALPKRILDNSSCGYVSILLLLILIALIIAIAKLFSNSKTNKSIPTTPVIPVTAAKNSDSESKISSPVIALPGVLPDEEIVIENPEEIEDADVKTNSASK